MSLVLEKFYENLKAVGVSAITGEGMDDFMAAVAECRKEYEAGYLPELNRRKAVSWGRGEPLDIAGLV